MKTNVVTAPEHRYFPPKSLKIFLAGGICNCIKWQDIVIESFTNYDIETDGSYDSLYLLNPRRVDWLDREGEEVRQIEWEFDMIEKCDLFTMFFAGGDSDQPICQYELGRNIERMKQKFPGDWYDRIIITCDSSYKRLNDVLIQTRLATNDMVKVNVVDGKVPTKPVYEHVSKIKESLKYIYCKEYYE